MYGKPYRGFESPPLRSPNSASATCWNTTSCGGDCFGASAQRHACARWRASWAIWRSLGPAPPQRQHLRRSAPDPRVRSGPTPDPSDDVIPRRSGDNRGVRVDQTVHHRPPGHAIVRAQTAEEVPESVQPAAGKTSLASRRQKTLSRQLEDFFDQDVPQRGRFDRTTTRDIKKRVLGSAVFAVSPPHWAESLADILRRQLLPAGLVVFACRQSSAFGDRTAAVTAIL